MSLACIYSRSQDGVDAPLVTCEVHLSGGLPGTTIVGLPETAVKEARDRVRAAILNARFDYPQGRVTVNLAPADLPKHGGRFDLPIALGILAASGQIPQAALAAHEFIGELALSGELRGVRGVLPAVLSAARDDRRMVVPQHNAAEAALVRDAEVLSATSLLQVCAHLCGEQSLPVVPATTQTGFDVPSSEDMRDVRGQQQARRALEVAAAGGHNLLFVGPPGTGKTMLASRLPGILPALEEEEALELAAVRSVAGVDMDFRLWKQRAFRAPITALRRQLWLAVARSRGLARSLWPITACFFLMNCPSTIGMCWKCCASHWSQAASSSLGPPTKPSSRHASSWWLR